jgi:cytoskeletal protein RodZ
MSSFGEEMRRERELREISLREIAEATKVNIRYLEAMERNEFQHLPGGVFNRGFVRAYAQFIGVDPEAMVNAYLLEEQAQGSRQTRSTEPLLRGRSQSSSRKSGAAAPAAPGRGKLLRWGLVALAIAVLVLVGLLIVDRLSAGSLLRLGGDPPAATERVEWTS